MDTTKAAIASASVAAGADIINDISGATFDSQMLPTVAELGVPIVLMHMRGTPKTMQTMTDYQDLIGEIYQFLQARVEAAIASGIEKSRIILDPGIGFAKTFDQNLEILRRLSEFRSLGCPILIGVSRKSFIGRILNQTDPQGRVWGTAGACAGAIALSLQEKLNAPLDELAGNDEVMGAIALYLQWKEQLLDLFHHASHGKRLSRLNCPEDLKYCAQTDILNVLPIQKEPGVLVKAES